MLGLSTTAIGGRSIQECLQIYEELKAQLDLSFFELAVGCEIDYDQQFDMPVVLHNNCLFKDGKRIKLSFDDFFESWDAYKHFINRNNVLAYTLHPPRLSQCKATQLMLYQNRLEAYLGVPVAFELMCEEDYHLSQKGKLHPNLPILLDISHVNIWMGGDDEKTAAAVATLISTFNVQAVHLSYNKGKRDSHDLIPEDYWAIDSALMQSFRNNPEIPITFESLPEAFGEYERLDKKEAKKKRGR